MFKRVKLATQGKNEWYLEGLLWIVYFTFLLKLI